MTNNSTYRASALVLAAIFCLFNIGFPVVIAACPMMSGNSPVPSCCAHRSGQMPSRGAVSLTMNCCKIYLAAERNHTEFIGEKQAPALPLQAGGLSAAWSFVIPAARVSPLLTTYTAPSPPAEDIPIFTSSLLI